MGFWNFVTDKVEKEQEKRKIKLLRTGLELALYRLGCYVSSQPKEVRMNNYITAYRKLFDIAPAEIESHEHTIYNLCKDLLEKPNSKKARGNSFPDDLVASVAGYGGHEVHPRDVPTPEPRSPRRTQRKPGRPKGSKNKRWKK
uniref:Uncharacterized protein n=1 Tax=viral metagenome TaxID=1070528 RepID=A0A6M3X5V2_9ZZZZ